MSAVILSMADGLAAGDAIPAGRGLYDGNKGLFQETEIENSVYPQSVRGKDEKIDENHSFRRKQGSERRYHGH